MADKRISQLVERVNIANNDVLPIVASGATTTNKVTVSTLQDWMQSNLDVGVTSVGLSMPSAFVVSNSPVTGSGNISVTGAGTVSQYIRGDGSLADFPSGGGGGGSSVNYYLNGSVSQGTIGGIAYQEMNRTPILGAGTDFTIAADGYIASFITDAGDPALLQIPAGNWNFETYLQASSGGGTPSFYIELYKVNSGGTATLIASNSANPELIAFGTSINPYFSALAVPQTTLALTDRLALRYYVTHSGRTITLHTENTTLCQIVTTFTTGLTALNGLTAQVQNFATGTSGTDFNISSSVSTHTFNLPNASATARGVVSTGSQTFAGAKTFNSSVTASSLIRTGGTSSQFLKADGSVDSSTYLTTGSAGSTYVPYSGAAANVDLGVYNLTASAIIANGSGSNSGIIHLESNAFHSLVNGYGSITSGTTNQFNFYQTTGAGVFRGAFLSLNSITASATRTYTLPDADGTLALTSSLDGYVTLATTQTITGAKTFDTTTSTFAVMNSTNANGGVLTFRRNGTNVGHIGNSAQLGAGVLDALEVRSGIGSSLILKSDGGQVTLATGGGVTLTGALNGTSATFSGAVSSNFNGSAYNATATSTNNAFTTYSNNSAANNTYIGLVGNNGVVQTNNDFEVFTGSSFTKRLTIASTGAATFSSSVTANYGGTFVIPSESPASGNVALTVRTSNGANDIFRWFDGATQLGVFKNSGNVGIGTASPSARLHLGGFSGAVNQEKGLKLTNDAGTIVGLEVGNSNDSYVGTISASNFSIRTGNTERMQITSGGVTKARANGGNYFGGGYHEFVNNSNVSGSVTFVIGNVAGSNTNNAASIHLVVADAAGDRLYIYGNGNVVNNNNSYGSLSDIKLKENIKDASPKLDDLMKVKVRNYNLIGDDKKQIGVIAQELEEVFPAMIDESEDFEELEVPQVDEEGNEILNEEGEVVTTKERVSKGTSTKSVKYSVFVPMLIKAIQELKTEIDSLKNQIK